MVTVNVTLTSGVDTDQTASAQAQISAAPNGTVGSPTIINMPAGRYRIDGGLRITGKSHQRWTCLDGVSTYPNVPLDTQAFVAYTDRWGGSLAGRVHFRIIGCNDVVGSFLRIEGPNDRRNVTYSNFALYNPPQEAAHAFDIVAQNAGPAAPIDCGFEDCSFREVYGDGVYIGGVTQVPAGVFTAPQNIHLTRIVGSFAGRHNLSVVCVDGLDVTDFIGDWAGYDGVDVEPNPANICWNVNITRMTSGAAFFPIAISGYANLVPAFGNQLANQDLTFTDFTVSHHGANVYGPFYVLLAGSNITIDGFKDATNKSQRAIFWGGNQSATNRWNNITIKNCIVVTSDPPPSRACALNASDSVTILNNTFNAIPGKVGFNELYEFYGTPPTSFTHYGNVWMNGTLNDPTGPSVFRAAKASFSGAGTATDESQGHFEGKAASFHGIGSADTFPAESNALATIGGAAFRLRGAKRPSRLGSVAGIRLRGQKGPSVRQSFRLRAAMGGGRLRSYQFPTSLRSGEPGVPITASGGFAAAPAVLHGSGSVAQVYGTGSFHAAAATFAGTAVESFSGTGAFHAAKASFAGTGTQSNAAFGNFAAARAALQGTGMVDAAGVGHFIAAPARFGGPGETGFLGTGAFHAAAASFAGLGGVEPPAYFLTPLDPILRVPHPARLEWVASENGGTGVPRSPRYRQFLGTQVGTDVEINGVVYGGGRWHGPLTPGQVAAITAAGYGDRIVRADEPGLLPAGID